MKRSSNSLSKVTRLALIISLGLVFFIGINFTVHASNLTFVVNSTGDAADANIGDSVCATAGGACTLRAAIQEANAIGGIDTIQFNIPVDNVGDVPTIKPNSPLPAIDDGLVLNGRTQPDSNLVELDGENAGDDPNTAIGLELTAGASTIKGMVINRFEASGIKITHACCADLYGNRIGTDPTGTIAEPNHGVGIYVFYSTNINIGGPNANQRNLISGNKGTGVLLFGDSHDNTVQGNYIGTDITGTVALGNAQGGIANHSPGIVVNGADNNLIGGPNAGEGNLVSGNLDGGIFIYGENTFNETENNVVQGNLIGTDVTGTLPLGNAGIGVYLGYSTNNNTIGGDVAGAGNVIADNGDGIIVGEYPTSEIENPFPNGPNGNLIQGNKIGTNAAGTQALGNGGEGILVRLATDTQIGGTTPEARNIIAGNDGDGIVVQYKTTLDIPRFARNTVIQGNYIGVGADGSTPIENQGSGIYDNGALDTTIGGTTADAGNIISASRDHGIYLSAQYDTTNPDYRMDGFIQNNKIGTDAGGTQDLGNGHTGIFICGLSNFTIGGPNAANVIAFNHDEGILLGGACTSPEGNPIRQNSIFSNGGLGIDLGNDGVTANDDGDADVGANTLQNYPELTTASVSGGVLHITGMLKSAASSSYTIDYFSNPACDSSGNGEGKEFLGSGDVVTNENGNAPLDFSANVTTNPDDVTATATDANGNTSEFSACKTLGSGASLSQYNIYNLNDSNFNLGTVTAINNHTQLVYTANNNGYLWQNLVPIELGTFENGQPPAIPWNLNDNGDVVGQASNENGQAHAFIWQSGEMTDLGTLSDQDQYSSSVAYGINSSDVVVGYERHTNGNLDQLGGAVKWENGSATLLTHAPGCERFCGSDIAHAINASGQIVGSASVDDYHYFGYCCDHAALWNGSALTMLDTEFNTDSIAQDINDSGQSVGVKRFFLQGYASVPMLWSGGGGGTSLLSNGYDDGDANAINNEGVVVGSANDYNYIVPSGAFIWTSATGMVSLNTLIDPASGWVLYNATGINDNGEIIGTGNFGNYLLRPSNLADLTGAPYVVTSTADAADANVGDGICATADHECTLRAAIQEANADPDITEIAFSIPGNDIPKITPNPSLPEITHPVVINGATQHDTNLVELSGENALDANAKGLNISAGDSTVTGLVINRFNTFGVYLHTKGNNKIQGNIIGTDTTGTQRRPNHDVGIEIDNSPNNLIGGTHAGDRNLISGNGDSVTCADVSIITEGLGEAGISITGNQSKANIVQGNYIGTDITGTSAVGNACLGVGIGFGASSNIVRGATDSQRNIISGNYQHTSLGTDAGFGVVVGSVIAPTAGNIVLGNYIGTDVNGTSAIPNNIGLYINAKATTIGGTSRGAGNVISGNKADGLSLQLGGGAALPVPTGVRAQGNIVGLDKTGTVPLPNMNGITLSDGKNVLIGGHAQGAGNIVSGNSRTGISVLTTGEGSTGIKIQGNFVGTDASAVQNLGNGGDGISVTTIGHDMILVGGKNNGEGNIVEFNQGSGIAAGDANLSGVPPVAIRANAIFENLHQGIKVWPDGAVPTVKSSQYSSSRLKVQGTVSGDPNKSYTLDFFSNAGCDAGEFGQGQKYLGSVDVGTDGTGSASYEYSLNNVPDGTVITATATREGKYSGSFSRCRTMTAAVAQAYVMTGGDCDGNTPCYTDINSAIDAADPDGTVNVAPGTYTGDIVLDADVNLNLGDSNGGGGGGGNTSVNKVARKAKRAQAAMDAGDYVVDGSLSILHGNFQAPAANLLLSGDLTLQNAGNFNNNGGTIVLDGNGTQHINGNFDFNNLTVNDGVTADAQDSATRVDGTFVNTGAAQNFQLKNVNNPDFFQNFQDLTGRNSARIRTTGNPDIGNMTVTTHLNQAPQTVCPTDDSITMVKRWYELERQDGNADGVSALVRFYYKATELNGADETALQIYHCNTTTQQWEALTTTSGSDGSGTYLQAQDVASFSPFGMGSPAAPTSEVVTKFQAKGDGTPAVHLKWKTANELQVAGFNILRSENGGDFAAVNPSLIIGKNPGSLNETAYSYDDLTVTAGTTYAYRLETVLTTNTSLHTEPITVTIPNAACAKSDTVTLLTPTNGDTLKHKGILDWTDAACATTYQIILRHAGKGHTVVANDKTLTVSQYAFEKMTKGKYQWRVRACTANDCGAWSGWSGFVIQGKSKKGK